VIAVIFEFLPEPSRREDYLGLAAGLKPLLDGTDGFLSIERFESLSEPGKMLSLSFWRDEEAVRVWRNSPSHRAAQKKGRHEIFRDYRLRIAHVARDYSMTDREEAPLDSRAEHDGA
jgi:heme-degrading monooxygenase HmoA